MINLLLQDSLFRGILNDPKGSRNFIQKNEKKKHPSQKGGSFLLTARSFLLTVGLCYLRWSFLLTVEIRFGLFYLRLKFDLVFFAYGGKSVWSFLLTVENRSRKLGLVFFTYGSPTVSKKDEP